MNQAIIICSRSDSSRIPNKPFKMVGKRPILGHLIKQLSKTDIPIILAVPREEEDFYRNAFDSPQYRVTVFPGSKRDPLKRMRDAAAFHNIDTVVRVCHDKIFVDSQFIKEAVSKFESDKTIDYLYSSSVISGASFEVFDFQILDKASKKFEGVEHISYAIRALSKKMFDLDAPSYHRRFYRLLIDYPEDLILMHALSAKLGEDLDLECAIELFDRNPWLIALNMMPMITIYTCVHNASDYIEECMKSVMEQSFFQQCEYIVVDDASTDDSYFKISKMAAGYKNIKIIHNGYNLGLASSSNEALKKAKGKYIVRMDADDFFCHKTDLLNLFIQIEGTGRDIIYPANFFGSRTKIQYGYEQHHVGGAIFNRSAINHIKFTDGLRGYEGLDFFERAKDQLAIGYLDRPVFFYRQHDKSMSKTDLKKREEIKNRIYAKVAGN